MGKVRGKHGKSVPGVFTMNMNGSCLHIRLLTGIFLAALLIRIVFVLNVHSTKYDGLFYWDALDYCNLAQNLASGKGYVDSDTGKPTILRAPGQPFFLAFVYLFFGHSHTAAKIVQALLSALTCILVYFIAYELTNSSKIALLSCVVFSVYPASVYYSGYLLSETLFTFFFTLFMLFLILEGKTNTLFLQFLTGFFLGLSALTRPVVLLFFIFIFFWKVMKRRRAGEEKADVKAGVSSSGLITFFVIVTLFPWMLRNYFIHKAFIPVSVYAGYTFWMSNHPYPQGFSLGYVTSDNRLAKAFKVKDEVKRDKIYMQEGIKFVIEEPFQLAKLSFFKLGWFVYPFDGEMFFGRYKYNIAFGLILSFLLAGVIAKSTEWRTFSVLYVSILYFALMALVFHGSPRYRFPIDSCFVILSVSDFYGFMERRNRKTLILTAAVLGVNLILFVFGNDLKFLLKEFFNKMFGYAAIFKK